MNTLACKSSIIPYAIFLALAGTARAEEAPQAPSAEVDDVDRIDGAGRDEVYSQGFRARNEADIGSAVTVISAADIEARQYSFAADALKEAPGVAVARNGSFGGFASARLRGGSSGQTLVVIDGVVVNDPSAPQGGFNFANLDVADIERIEVLRGPQGLVWGADAIGGVIAIRTKSAAPALSAYAEGGSRGTARGGASLSGALGGVSARATVSGVRSDGISRAASGSEKDGYRSIAASLSLGADLSPSADLSLAARFGDSHAEIDGFPPPTFSFGDTDETEDATDYSIAARLGHRAGQSFEGALTVGYSALDRRNEDAGAPTFSAEGDRLSALYWSSLSLARGLSLEAGGELERTSAKVSGVDESAKAAAVFAVLEARPADRIVLSAGARRDEFSNFEGATTTRVSGVWTLIEDRARLRASWGQGFRAPTLFELNFDQFGIVPNPDLRPERARGFDAGVELEAGPDAVGRSRLRVTYFRQRVRDQIDFSFAQWGYYNLDRVKSEGVEVEADWAPLRVLKAHAAYAFVDARDAISGARVLRTPKHSGAITLTLSPTRRLDVSSTIAFNGREDDFPTPNDSFVKLDLRAALKLSETIDVYGRVENATDADYEDVSGYGEPGASVFAGLRLRR